MTRLLHHVRRVALLQASNSLTDAELMQLFVSHRDEGAFEAILRRHAPMVLAVCRRVLRHAHDAEDAFQATFMVLARKAPSLRSRDLLGHWLYGIAFRTALKARVMNAKRRARESQAKTLAQPELADGASSEELLARLDHEISRLPEKYRIPVVLCELQGQSRKQVANRLGLPEGTLSSRLAHARKVLAQRLRTNGAMCGSLMALNGSAVIPSRLLSSTARAAVQVATGSFLRAGSVSAQVLILTDGVMKAMFLSKLKSVGAVMLFLALGVGTLTYRSASAQSGPSATRASTTAADEIEEMRLEIAALRKGLEATRQRVRQLEQKVSAQTSSRGSGTFAPSRTDFGQRFPIFNESNPPLYGQNKIINVQPYPAFPQTDSNPYTPQILNNNNPYTPQIFNPSQKGQPTANPAKLPPDNAQRTAPKQPTNPATHQGNGEHPHTRLPAGPTAQQRQVSDPISQAEAALEMLRRNPNDVNARKALERVLQSLPQRDHKDPFEPRDR